MVFVSFFMPAYRFGAPFHPIRFRLYAFVHLIYDIYHQILILNHDHICFHLFHPHQFSAFIISSISQWMDAYGMGIFLCFGSIRCPDPAAWSPGAHFGVLVLLSDVFRVCAWYSSASTYVAASVHRVLIAIGTVCRGVAVAAASLVCACACYTTID